MGTIGTARRGKGSAAAMNPSLLAWFDVQGRDLAFRRTREPYAVLVSEVMLQQTQAARVEPSWTAFMERFPTVAALATASPAEVIRAWDGLGYNGRAVRLRRAAEAIVRGHAGRVPDEVATLEGLPGVGPYTARAVAAIAFGRPVAAIDTNVGRVVRRVRGRVVRRVRGRVVRRVRGLTGSGGAADPPADIQALADDMVDAGRPADWTYAMMDVGALLCRPREPLCGECPLRSFCRSTGMAAAQQSPQNGVGVPFPATRRWLRGRIVARLRSAPDGRWVRFDGAIGEHSAAAVDTALRQLAADGLVERDRSGRARLPPGAAPEPRA